jgi:hypothetical protein
LLSLKAPARRRQPIRVTRPIQACWHAAMRAMTRAWRGRLLGQMELGRAAACRRMRRTQCAVVEGWAGGADVEGSTDRPEKTGWWVAVNPSTTGRRPEVLVLVLGVFF